MLYLQIFFTCRIDDPRYNVTASPSEPIIYAFEFPDNVSAVAIFVRSYDTICAMISIQDYRVTFIFLFRR